MRRFSVIWASAVLLSCAGCDFPRDADGTLDRVRQTQLLRVGIGERPPWITIRDGTVSGIEARLVRAWASQLGAEVDWIEATESALAQALAERKIDMIVAGVTRHSPLLKHAAPTQPCLHAAVVVAAPSGADPSRSLAHRVVAYPRQRPDFAAMIAAKEAEPKPVADVRGEFAAVYAFEAEPLGMTPGSTVLARENLVMLVPKGENVFLLELDRFLSRRCDTAISEFMNDEARRPS